MAIVTNGPGSPPASTAGRCAFVCIFAVAFGPSSGKSLPQPSNRTARAARQKVFWGMSRRERIEIVDNTETYQKNVGPLAGLRRFELTERLRHEPRLSFIHPDRGLPVPQDPLSRP